MPKISEPCSATSQTMLPSKGVLRAAKRWIRLLGRSDIHLASALIRSNASYTDLSLSQYFSALDWLRMIGLVSGGPNGLTLAHSARGLPSPLIDQMLFELSLEASEPPWLPDADVLVPGVGHLPQDATDLARVCGIDEDQALLAVRRIHGRIDLALRAEVGAAGELQLAELLEKRSPGSTTHLALDHDGLGYDLACIERGTEWHLEVKTTTRRGRLVAHLTRHEHDVGRIDQTWRLVVVGLDDQHRLAALATVKKERIFDRAPREVAGGAKWETARYPFSPADLQAGLSMFGGPDNSEDAASVLFTGCTPQESFSWMPEEDLSPILRPHTDLDVRIAAPRA